MWVYTSLDGMNNMQTIEKMDVDVSLVNNGTTEDSIYLII